MSGARHRADRDRMYGTTHSSCCVCALHSTLSAPSAASALLCSVSFACHLPSSQPTPHRIRRPPLLSRTQRSAGETRCVREDSSSNGRAAWCRECRWESRHRCGCSLALCCASLMLRSLTRPCDAALSLSCSLLALQVHLVEHASAVQRSPLHRASSLLCTGAAP